MNDLVLALTVFVACAVEAVEALTIVLAAGLTREWRSTFQGMAAALVVLAIVVAALGPALTLIPISALRLVVGALLAIFGLMWLRKAILRATGHKALHDEASAYLREVEAAKAAERRSRRGVNDWYAFTLAFKGVLLEGLEVVFIVLTFGINQGSIWLAAIGCRRGGGGDRRSRDRGPGAAGEGARERDEVRGRHHAYLVRHVLGRRRRRRRLARRRRGAARADPGLRPGLPRLHGAAAPRLGNPGRSGNPGPSGRSGPSGWPSR